MKEMAHTKKVPRYMNILRHTPHPASDDSDGGSLDDDGGDANSANSEGGDEVRHTPPPASSDNDGGLLKDDDHGLLEEDAASDTNSLGVDKDAEAELFNAVERKIETDAARRGEDGNVNQNEEEDKDDEETGSKGPTPEDAEAQKDGDDEDGDDEDVVADDDDNEDRERKRSRRGSESSQWEHSPTGQQGPPQPEIIDLTGTEDNAIAQDDPIIENNVGELLQHIKTLEKDNERLKDDNECLTNQCKCPVCHELKEHMYIMECGHRTCSDCSLQLEKCHTCRATPKKRSGWLKRVYV